MFSDRSICSIYTYMRDATGKLHARLGDFWWYSLMLFCACRAADAKPCNEN